MKFTASTTSIASLPACSETAVVWHGMLMPFVGVFVVLEVVQVSQEVAD